MDDLNSAVEAIKESVKLTLRDHPDQADHLTNLGNALKFRFERTGLMKDLNAVVEVIEESVKVTPRHHPNRAIYLNNVGNALQNRLSERGQ